MRALSCMLAAVFLSACSHLPAGGANSVAPDLVTHYRIVIDAALDGQQVSVEQTSSFTSPADGVDAHTTHLAALPAWVTDLSSAGGGGSEDLAISVRPSRSDDGVIVYEVMIAQPGAPTSQPFGLTENPRLTIAEGETATVHLAQEAGEIYSRFTLDLNPIDAAD